MTKIKRLEGRSVETMPTTLEPGVLYVSEAYGTAAHLCACGCGSKIRTPLGPTEWTIDGIGEKVTVTPSVGNWQKPCRSHYLIEGGEIVWCREWSEASIQRGRKSEEARRTQYYAERAILRWPRFLRWLVRLLKR